MMYEMFPESYIQLQKELATGYHPKLEKILAEHPADDIDMKIAQTASYCRIVLDRVYTLEERIKLCDILREKLIGMRENPNKGLIVVH